MYCSPLDGEGLFALDEADATKLGKPDATERDLPFDFKPGVDYFKRFDAILPPWRPAPFSAMPGSHAALTPHTESNGPIEARIGKRQTRTLSHRRYVRAVHPDGGLRQLVIASCRTSPYYPDGFDKAGTLQRLIVQKGSKGWLIVEPEPLVWNILSGRQGQEYAAWALAVMEYRVRRTKAYTTLEGEAFKAQSVREANARAEESRAAMRDMGLEIAKTVAELTQQPRVEKSRRGDVDRGQ